MALIEFFFVPLDELRGTGLAEINMKRLGRFVALAGKNGAGKSRLLASLRNFVSVRAGNFPLLHEIEQSIVQLEIALTSTPTSHAANRWKADLETHKKSKALALDRVVTSSLIAEIKAINFVPKNLNLHDPRQSAIREIVNRSRQAQVPGVDGYESSCLFYIQSLQDRWWNASHQLSSVSDHEKNEALTNYESFCKLVKALLGEPLVRDLNGDPILFEKPISDAFLSDGQKVILQLCVALHAQKSELKNTVFLLDEPENHLHPSAVIDLLKKLYDVAESTQIWVATHSIPLLAYIASVEPMSIWYVNDGKVANAGRNPKIVLDSLLGDEDRIAQLYAFTGLPAQLAAVNYASESLLPPQVIATGANDPQVNQIEKLIRKVATSDIVNLLDYGAGKGRLLQGLAAPLEEASKTVATSISYFAFDVYADDKNECLKTISESYQDSESRYFNDDNEFFSSKDEKSIDVVVMCNVLHEIPPQKWLPIFSIDGLISRALKDDGYLLIVEDQRIPVGEKAHDYGFLVLDTSQIKTLFCITEAEMKSDLFCVDDRRGDGRLKAHLISKSLLNRITSDSRKAALTQLCQSAKQNIQKLMVSEPSYANGQIYAFWLQQFANSSLFLTEN
ncbi:hypothetical protein B9Z35_02160 [Limnohabitans sp. Jir61]|uniref:AAA family ATPase n=1 Tax=Limnohabitans sp. Jir61 TaxID=1826168 RepID=UPI000D385EF6|nr:AAA family ATPase [Limnohabitans sp. Jir61]PUE32368.1 hypothetical protein B9Z35_02160 [Limnohabitans sp. Jir61]